LIRSLIESSNTRGLVAKTWTHVRKSGPFGFAQGQAKGHPALMIRVVADTNIFISALIAASLISTRCATLNPTVSQNKSEKNKLYYGDNYEVLQRPAPAAKI